MASFLSKWLMLSRCSGRYAFCRRRSGCIPTSPIRLFTKRRDTAASASVLNYEELQRVRRNAAQRSVLILHPSQQQPVLEHCCKHGPIARAILYRYNDKNYTLIEYRKKSSVDQLLANANQFPNLKRIATESRFLYFHPVHSPTSGADDSRVIVDRRMAVDNYGTSQLTDSDLSNCHSVEQQIWLLYDQHVLSPLGSRLRYFLCSEIETFLRKLYSDAAVHVFGSTVNGFGRFDCDLDMVLDLDATASSADCDTAVKREGGLFFLTKEKTDSRRFEQQTLDTVGRLLKFVIPQTMSIHFILKARVPIVKFEHCGSGIACDLCLDNKSALLMSELLFYLSQMVSCVHEVPKKQRYGLSALVFAIRQWARCNAVTHPNPGPYLSNFMLTLLTVFFLQTRSQPALPALKSLKNLPGPGKQLSDDIRIPYSCTISSAQPDKIWQLGDLLVEFFEYYSKFDFSSNGLSIIEGSTVEKPDPEVPLYIENPIERELNVAKNVNEAHLESFQSLCREACDKLQASIHREERRHWGLLTVLTSHSEELDRNTIEETSLNGDETGSEVVTAGIETWLTKETGTEDFSGDEEKGGALRQSRLNVRMQDILSESESIDRTAAS